MAAWLPVIKTAIPVIAQIVSVAAPMLTKKPSSEGRDALTAQQISELQTAATQNAASVKELAAQVQNTFEGLELAASDLQKRLDRLQLLSFLAALFGLFGTSLSLYMLIGS